MNDEQKDRPELIKGVTEIVAEIWQSGKNDSQVFDFQECILREKWVARLLALIPDCEQKIQEAIDTAIGAYESTCEALIEEVKREERERIRKAYEREWYGVTDTYCPQGLVDIRQALKEEK